MASIAAWPCADPCDARAALEKQVDALEERAARFAAAAELPDALSSRFRQELIDEGLAIMRRNDELRAQLAEWWLQ
jgi:hypothetical protein